MPEYIASPAQFAYSDEDFNSPFRKGDLKHIELKLTSKYKKPGLIIK